MPDQVTMYVFEELINGKKLTEIINETHENVKYLPGHKLPENVVSIRLKEKILFIHFLFDNKEDASTRKTRSIFLRGNIFFWLLLVSNVNTN